MLLSTIVSPLASSPSKSLPSVPVLGFRMDQSEGPSSHASPSAIRSTKSTKRVFSRLLRPSEQAAIDDELADLEEVIHHSSFAPLPAVLTPSRAPSNKLIASSRTVCFEAPIHLDFASDWTKGPVIEWYERHRSNGSTLIEKLQLRRDLQPPYYHEYIVVFTQGGHTYRVDRRPDPDAPFDTIMRAGCKPYDTIQAVESRSLRELEKVSDCMVEVHWHGKPTIDLLFILSICFALRQDESAKQYTLQRYNCYFLSWTIIMAVVRKMAAWETRLGDVMSEAFLHVERKANYRVATLSQGDDAWTMGQYLENHSRHHMELALALVRVCVLVRSRSHVHVNPSMAMALARVRALEPPVEPAQLRAQVRAQVREVRELERLELELEMEREWVRRLEPELVRVRERVRKLEVARALMRTRPWALPRARVQELELERELELEQVRELELERERELSQSLARRRKLDLDLDRAVRLTQELVPRLVGLVLEHSADAMSRLLFPATLDVWQSTMLQNMQSRPLSKSYV